MVNKYSLPNGLQCTKRIQIFSTAEEENKEKYSKEALALMGFIRSRQGMGVNKTQRKTRNQSIETFKRTRSMNRLKAGKSVRELSHSQHTNGIEIVPYRPMPVYSQMDVHQNDDIVTIKSEEKAVVDNSSFDKHSSKLQINKLTKAKQNDSSITDGKGIVTIKRSKPTSQYKNKREEVTCMFKIIMIIAKQ